MLYTYYDKKTMEYELYSNISYCFMAFVAFMKIDGYCFMVTLAPVSLGCAEAW